MSTFFNNNIIPGIYSAIFLLIFLGVYKKFDFPKWIIKDRLKIKNEVAILLLIILTPIILIILVNLLWEEVFKYPSMNNQIVDSIFIGFMWSMVFNFKNYKK